MIRFLGIVFLCFAFISCYKTTEQVELEKYKELIIAKELSKFYEISLDTTGKSENVKIRKWSDDEFEVSYIYDNQDSNEYIPLIYYLDISKWGSIDDAKTEFQLIKLQFRDKLFINSEDEVVKELDSFSAFGNQNFYATRMINNKPNGVLYAFRKKKVIFSLIMLGYKPSNNQIFIDSLILPQLQNIESFKL